MCQNLNELGDNQEKHECDRTDFLTPFPVAGPRIITNSLALYVPKNGATTLLCIYMQVHL